MSPDQQVNALMEDIESFDKMARGLAVNRINNELTHAAEGAVTQMIYLAAHASNERLKFDACKYILEKVLPIDGGKGPDDPVSRLMDELMVEIQEAANPANNHTLE